MSVSGSKPVMRKYSMNVGRFSNNAWQKTFFCRWRISWNELKRLIQPTRGEGFPPLPEWNVCYLRTFYSAELERWARLHRNSSISRLNQSVYLLLLYVFAFLDLQIQRRFAWPGRLRSSSLSLKIENHQQQFPLDRFTGENSLEDRLGDVFIAVQGEDVQKMTVILLHDSFDLFDSVWHWSISNTGKESFENRLQQRILWSPVMIRKSNRLVLRRRKKRHFNFTRAPLGQHSRHIRSVSRESQRDDHCPRWTERFDRIHLIEMIKNILQSRRSAVLFLCHFARLPDCLDHLRQWSSRHSLNSKCQSERSARAKSYMNDLSERMQRWSGDHVGNHSESRLVYQYRREYNACDSIRWFLYFLGHWAVVAVRPA